jgi:hypothetical protein
LAWVGVDGCCADSGATQVAAIKQIEKNVFMWMLFVPGHGINFCEFRTKPGRLLRAGSSGLPKPPDSLKRQLGRKNLTERGKMGFESPQAADRMRTGAGLRSRKLVLKVRDAHFPAERAIG